MSRDHILWVHGHSAEIEYPDLVHSIVLKGKSISIEGKSRTTNWLHFAVPTPVIVDNYRMQPVAFEFRYKRGRGTRIHTVDVFDGEKKIASHDRPVDRDDNGWRYVNLGVNIGEIQTVRYGIGISIGLSFRRKNSDDEVKIEFASAGCVFNFANRIASQRLQIYTKKAPMEFPYRSSLPINDPPIKHLMHGRNKDITRILISLHGSGGNADFYLSNGLAAVQAAIDHGVDLAAADNTLIIAPQLINVGEYYKKIAPNILHWRNGRALGAESVEGDLDGDGIPDSGTLSSFTVMDTLLERVCRLSLFPNLAIVVIVGHSNGGRFMSCYAATSRFEQEVASPRGIHVRYVVSGSGRYLYMNDSRYAFEDDTYLGAADPNVNWRDTIVDLARVDFSSVCDEDPEKFNDWPLGLSNLDPNTYPAQVGETTIYNQFGTRDVHYLVGSKDLSKSYPECPERVQGQNTLAKALLYHWHLEQLGWNDCHHLHIVPNAWHSGKLNMCSDLGSRAIFGSI
jgi:pimeloyl-ACP methyl ester carboxylesterase